MRADSQEGHERDPELAAGEALEGDYPACGRQSGHVHHMLKVAQPLLAACIGKQ